MFIQVDISNNICKKTMLIAKLNDSPATSTRAGSKRIRKDGKVEMFYENIST